jgi:hypothetical protein
MGLRERLVDPRSPNRRPRRAAYALPTLFTAGNIFLGYISILRSFKGAMLAASGAAGAPEHFVTAAKAMGAAVFLDGLDGRIARMTNTTSEFGREMDPSTPKSAARFSTPDISSHFFFCSAAPSASRASTFRRTPFPRIPGAPTASISLVCPFPPPPPWSLP